MPARPARRSLRSFVSCAARLLDDAVPLASRDGLLLVRFWESRFQFDVPATGESMLCAIRDMSFFTGMDINPEVTRFVCNPLSGELYRLPDLDGT